MEKNRQITTEAHSAKHLANIPQNYQGPQIKESPRNCHGREKPGSCNKKRTLSEKIKIFKQGVDFH